MQEPEEQGVCLPCTPNKHPPKPTSQEIHAHTYRTRVRCEKTDWEWKKV